MKLQFEAAGQIHTLKIGERSLFPPNQLSEFHKEKKKNCICSQFVPSFHSERRLMKERNQSSRPRKHSIDVGRRTPDAGRRRRRRHRRRRSARQQR